jgi:hypothetical protein
VKLAWLAIAGVAAGCAGELDDPERFADCPPGLVEQVFQAQCGTCHSGPTPEGALDLAGPGVGDRVMGITSGTALCEGLLLVDPAGGSHLLLDKLSENPPCGGRMPFGQAALPGTAVECVRRWIDEMVAAP